MTRQSFLAALFGALLSTAAFAQGPLLYIIQTVTGGDMPTIQFSVAKSGSSIAVYPSIQTAINDIITDATNIVGTNPFTIQFETGTKVLDIGTATATFGGGTGKIILEGKITSASATSMVPGPAGTVIIESGISVESSANIENTMSGNAICINGGEAKIVGGTVKANTNAIDFPINSSVGGSVVLGGSPTITGNMNVRTGALSVDPTFAPAGKQYTLLIYGAAGSVAVGGGANFASNFTLDARSGNLILEKSGNDLVLAAPSNSSSSNCGLVECLHPSSSSSGGGSSSSYDPTPIATYPTPAIHSENPTYYTMKGEPVGSTKPAKPGVYLIKQGSSVRKIVVR